MIFKNRLFMILISISVLACIKTKHGSKTIAISHYLLDVPENCELNYERGLDSQPGYINAGDFKLSFDYGAFTDTLLPTRQQFLTNWTRIHKWEIGERYMKPGIEYDDKTSPKVDIIDMRAANKKDSIKFGSCDMIAVCQYKRDKFEYPVVISKEIKDHVFEIDTVRHHFRKLIYPSKGKTGNIGILIRDERGNMFNSNIYPALAITSGNLNAKQQQIAIAILKTLRPKQKGQ